MKKNNISNNNITSLHPTQQMTYAELLAESLKNVPDEFINSKVKTLVILCELEADLSYAYQVVKGSSNTEILGTVHLVANIMADDMKGME